eukprot:GHVS01087989.1.p1 GENE.GHVS01087989.1~~GHVS01087989.1.p1  ORF type:complete len:669 (+),score=105.05 GHVS01087989.1:800-2806(+)
MLHHAYVVHKSIICTYLLCTYTCVCCVYYCVVRTMCAQIVTHITSLLSTADIATTDNFIGITTAVMNSRVDELSRTLNIIGSHAFQQLCVASYGLPFPLRLELRQRFSRWYLANVECKFASEGLQRDITNTATLENCELLLGQYKQLLDKSTVQTGEVVVLEVLAVRNGKEWDNCSKVMQMFEHPDLRFFCQKMTEDEYEQLLAILCDNMMTLLDDERNFAVASMIGYCSSSSSTGSGSIGSGSIGSNSSGNIHRSCSGSIKSNEKKPTNVRRITVDVFAKMKASMMLKMKDIVMSKLSIEEMAELFYLMEFIRIGPSAFAAAGFDFEKEMAALTTLEQYADYIVKEYLCSWRDDSILGNTDTILEMDDNALRERMQMLFSLVDNNVLVRGESDDIPCSETTNDRILRPVRAITKPKEEIWLYGDELLIVVNMSTAKSKGNKRVRKCIDSSSEDEMLMTGGERKNEGSVNEMVGSCKVRGEHQRQDNINVLCSSGGDLMGRPNSSYLTMGCYHGKVVDGIQEGNISSKFSHIRTADHQSDVKGVYWHQQRQRWAATWREGGKERYKYFSARNLGFNEALREAEEYRKLMEEKGKAEQRRPAEHQSGAVGVAWKSTGYWAANWMDNKKKRHKSFSVGVHGFEGAKKLAIEHRREVEERLYVFSSSSSAV